MSALEHQRDDLRIETTGNLVDHVHGRAQFDVLRPFDGRQARLPRRVGIQRRASSRSGR
jgi:hypothetical protein